jgi:hypothetical protein
LEDKRQREYLDEYLDETQATKEERETLANFTAEQ